jgi:cytochrome c
MHDCATATTIASFLPDFARNQHGNLAEQNRTVGAQRGVDTSRPPATATTGASVVATAPPAEAPPTPASTTAMALTRKHACVACHAVDGKIVGPAFRDVARKYGDRADAVAYLAGKIRSGGAGLWGSIPMPPQTLDDADARTIANWLASGAPP